MGLQHEQQNGKCELKPYDHIWIPCTVEKGSFPNERFVRIASSPHPWEGIVDETSIKGEETGDTFVKGYILEIVNDVIMAEVPGFAHSAGLAKTSRTMVHAA